MLLDKQGKRLLELLISVLPTVKPGNPRTYITYKQIHERLGLSLHGGTYGRSLQQQGLNSLADWTAHEEKPAITGLIVDNTTRMPGNGYFRIFNKQENDFTWWEDEIRRSISFDWTHYISQDNSSKSIKTINALAEELNELARNYAIGTLQDIRTNIRGLDRRPGSKIFSNKTISNTRAFHHGGRLELQFNIGIEETTEGQELRHGVAFSFQKSQTLPNPQVLIPKVRLFNEFMRYYPEKYADMSMWYWLDKRSLDQPPAPIKPELITDGVFIFLGKHRLLSETNTAEILKDFDRLLPLFQYVESGGSEAPNSAPTEMISDFRPGFTERSSTRLTTLTERKLDINLRHNILQYALCRKLAENYGIHNVTDEYYTMLGTRIDVVLRRNEMEFWYYEIKTSLSPRACLREAIGQILEYAFWPGAREAKKLIVCGESPIDPEGIKYLQYLNDRFNLPICYEQISLPDET